MANKALTIGNANNLLDVTINQNLIIGSGGNLTLAQNPTLAMHAATKDYVDTQLNALDTQVKQGITEGYLPLAGGQMTGAIGFNSMLGVGGYTGSTLNDYWRIFGYISSSSDRVGALIIGTAYTGEQSIILGQYSDTFQTPVRLAYLLDGDGNTQFPGTVSATKFTCSTTPTTDTELTNKAYVDSRKVSGDFYTVSLPVANWSGTSAPYTQTATVTGLTADDNPIMGISYPDSITSETAEDYENDYGCISKAMTAADSITVTCLYEKPSQDLQIYLKT